MATPAALEALAATAKALRDIRVKVQPLLMTLYRSDDPREMAEARAGVALTLGTLRFLAKRLHGHKQQGPADPLRLELNRMRKLLVKVQSKAAATVASTKRTEVVDGTPPTPKRRRRK